MKDLVYKKKDVLGLDIGTTNIKYVQLNEKGSLVKLVGYGFLKVPENIIIEGIITEPEKLAQIFKKELKDPPWGKITAERVTAALPDAKLFTHVLELPPLTEKEIEEAIALEIDQSIPVSASDLYTDWQIAGETKDKTFVFMAAAPKVIVDSYVQFFKLISMEPFALEISLAATARAVISEKENTEPSLILDIGGETTNMAIFDKGIQVAGSHHVGAETIKESLIRSLDIDAGLLQPILHKGITEGEKSSEVIKEGFRKILTEAERMINYFEDRKENKNISKIILSGGMAALNGLGPYIEESTKVKTIVGNPWSNISIYPLKPVPKNDAPMFSTAIGLSLRGIRDE